MPRILQAPLAFAGVLAVCLACSADPGNAVDAAAPAVEASAPGAGSVVAEVGGRSVTLQELDARLASDLYEVRSRGLEQMIGELVLEQEANRRGIPTSEVVDAIVAQRGSVSEAAVQAFFDENNERMPEGATVEEYGPQIQRYLEQERRGEVMSELVANAKVVTHLEPPRVQVAASGPAKGPADAPVTIVEFSDYQCPYCQRAEAVVTEVLEKYPNQVRFVYRHFPLESIHPQARSAAVAAVCAEKQERFWEFHEKLFADQGGLGEEAYRRMAEELELDLEAFDTCRSAAESDARIAGDLKAGAEAGARGTPAFFVNGIHLSGALPLEEFAKVIDKELARVAAGS